LNLVRQIDRWLGHQATPVSDRILFRINGDNPAEKVTFKIDGTEYKLMGLESLTYDWYPSENPGMLNLVVYSNEAAEPFELKVSTGSADSTDTISLRESIWQTWQPTNLASVEYMWVGSSLFPDKSNLGRSIAKQAGDWEKAIIPLGLELAWTFIRFD
jgi:hypothetical protein